MKTVLLLVGVALFFSCSSSKPESKFNFSNVQSTSLGAQNYNNSPNNIMKDTVIVIQPQIFQPKQ